MIKKQKKLNIIKCNQLLAEFMKLEKRARGYYWRGFGFYHKTLLQFDHNFEWLMEVWKEIETFIHINSHIIHHDDRPVKHIVSFSTRVNGEHLLMISEGYSEDSKIEAMYRAVVGFVEWYNKEVKELG